MMRKQNSKFRSLYLSNQGTQLHNNDFYASVEGNYFACYVVADGMESGDSEDPGARIAAEAVIEAFNDRPSISRMALQRYVQKAHIALSTNKQELRASITVVVTDYKKVRVSHVGNARFAFFRKGSLYRFTSDHSLSWEMMEEGEISKDIITRHEERDNLSRYLGQRGLTRPDTSRKIKLQDGDIIALYSRGFWENCDEDDLLAQITDAGDDPQKALENAEEVLLDDLPDPENVDNYTLGLVYVDKVYSDPVKAQRRKKIIKIVVIVVMVLLIVGLMLFFWLRSRHIKRENMETAYTSGIEYIIDENYIRAKEELDTACGLAEDLRDSGRKTELDEFRRMVEAVIGADDLLDSGSYSDAQAAYLQAQSRSRYTDNVAGSYISRRLEQTAGYLNVQDYIALGDTLTDQGNYDSAEEKYLQARSLASKLYYSEGKQEALEALNRLYEKMQDEVDAANDQAATETVAAEYIVLGDNAVKEGDLSAAAMYYTLAKEQYTELGNEAVLAAIEERLAAVEKKRAENEDLAASAKGYVAEGDKLMAKKKYEDAKRKYILARTIYSGQDDQENLELVQEKIDAADAGIARLAEGESAGQNRVIYTENGERA